MDLTLLIRGVPSSPVPHSTKADLPKQQQLIDTLNVLPVSDDKRSAMTSQTDSVNFFGIYLQSDCASPNSHLAKWISLNAAELVGVVEVSVEYCYGPMSPPGPSAKSLSRIPSNTRRCSNSGRMQSCRTTQYTRKSGQSTSDDVVGVRYQRLDSRPYGRFGAPVKPWWNRQ